MDIKQEYFQENDSLEEEGWNIRNLVIVPGCCEKSSKLMTVALQLSYDEIYEQNKEQDNCTPQWVINSSFKECLEYTYREDLPRLIVKFCPHCATPMPAIQLRQEPLFPVLSVADGGYYCDTCDERLSSCSCWPPEAKWEVVPKDKVIKRIS